MLIGGRGECLADNWLNARLVGKYFFERSIATSISNAKKLITLNMTFSSYLIVK